MSIRNSKKIFVFPDSHFGPLEDGGPGHDEEAFMTALKGIEIIRPDEFIHIGDMGEFLSCSPWEKKNIFKPNLQYTLDRLAVDYKEINHHMDRIDAVLNLVGCKKRTLIEGNHEVWVERMIGDTDVVAKEYAVPRRLHLRERGWAFAPYGEYVKRGKLRLYHGGHYMGVNHAKDHAVKCGCSIMYGHVHDIQTATVPSVEGPHGGFSIGCLCRLSKKFLKGRLTNWQHGFATIHLRDNGSFNVGTHRIEDGWAIVNGTEIFGGKLVAGRPRKTS